MTEVAIFAVSSFLGLGIYHKIRLSHNSNSRKKIFLTYQKGICLGREISKILRPTPSQITLPEYKWFSKIVEVLLTLQKNFGMPIQSCLKHIRSTLVEDVKLERKRFGEVLSSSCQFLIISIMTIVFYSTFVVLIAKVSLGVLLQILCVQLIGGSLFFLVENKVHKKYFYTIDRVLCSMMKLSVLSNANLPNQKILALSLDELPKDVLNTEEGLFRDNFLEAVDKWKNQGSEIGDELRFQMSELNDYRSYQREKFLRFVGALKFSFLGLFFLSSYLFLILKLSGSLLT